MPRSEGGVDPTIVEQMLQLRPHIERAIRLGQQLHFKMALNEVLCHCLACWDIGIALLDVDAVVQFANPAFERMLNQSSNLRCHDQHLQFRESSLNSRFKTTVSKLARTERAALLDESAAYLVARRDGNMFYQLVLMSLPKGAAIDTQGVLVMLSDPSYQLEGRMEIAGRLYGFTRSEKQVAERILAGQTPNDIALSLTVARSTVVSHLKKLFRKTGTNRQADLTRLLLHLPAISSEQAARLGVVEDEKGLDSGD
ncbi:LuxR C-terminal-related transcriptional regulator [Chitinivorax sp. B]|uniref:helix-turn-helix transcriptional regulator n=1 Tax=Chitinivorax sp. B TaxID=2502235 RepID=UPI0014853BEE|nr:LuxR C-terminal-related transcriptional regulator [Chitinivorax sp. B]